MTSCFVLLIFSLLYFQQKAVALQVTPGSSCASVCLDDPANQDASSTNSSDIVCNDQEYSTTTAGIRFKNCVECLQESHAMSNGENDISWYLYNLRYSVDVCIYGFPNATKTISSPCDIDYACRPLKQALETGNLNPDNGTQLDYCTADGGAFNGSQLQDCVQCFRSSANQFYMSNFLTALQAGCEQKPQAGDLLGLSGSLFTQFQVNITAAPQNQTTASDDKSKTTMTTGAIVGIAVGATLLFLGGTGLFWVYHRKQKYLYGSPLESQNGRKSISPPLVGNYSNYYGNTQNSLPTNWKTRAQQPYTNNADYYDQTEKVVQGNPKSNYTYNPNQLGLPTHPAYLPRVASRTASRNDTPSPPPPIKSNKPDDFAINSYLNAAPSMNQIIPTPYIPAAATTASDKGPLPLLPTQFQAQPYLYPHLQPPQPQPTYPTPQVTISLPNHAPPPHPIFTSAAPPPPPPPGQPAPRLSLPSKARKPMKYVPPRITVDRPLEEVTPPHSRDHDDYDDDRDEVLSIGFEIPNPTPRREQEEPPRWGQESHVGYGIRMGTPPEQHRQEPQVAEHRVVDRRRRVTEFTDMASIHSTHSDLYG
ncbi:uncharacterized protein GGS22DRAFT_165430 [Annulohypoxylon maeteangense]|uniref:uncharacterized protein n=1 Tax=Annulohypoxylon maeteangense TaxID=1927788 RepID=UPI0020076B67|nr:uncharacterized protein GGS22DRAFT_165430 [Annulohypoxylon maeteangense]KAI0884341.1 hypothetical protein GGS22DRAFT_165430 [Annulohypoxylon maeteangense]